MDFEKLKQEYINWQTQKTQFYAWSSKVAQVETTTLDAYGRHPFVVVEEKDGYFTVTDDGALMYKYDPLEENEELEEYAPGMIEDSGFDYDEEHCVIYKDVYEKDVPAVITGLIQLEVMISFIA